MSRLYEAHTYPDQKFPIIFHTDYLETNTGTSDQVLHANKQMFGCDCSYMHWHEGIEFLYFLDGSADVHINEKTVRAVAGDCVVINSDCLHKVFATGKSCLYHCLIINCDLCRDWGFDPVDNRFVPKLRDDRLSALMTAIESQYQQKEPYYKQIVTARCMELMVLMSRHYVETTSADNQPALKKAALVQQIMRYIGKSFDQPITLESVSENFGYSRFYLSHIFTEYTDMSVVEYLRQTRVNAAQRLLSGSEESVREIALACGYRNCASFSVAFHKMTGQTPTQYRHQIRQ